MTKKATILIVDDEDINLDILEANLGPFGYEILRSSDGRQAKETANQHRPDLVITDILMPNMDGYQLCRTLKADRDLSATPVIFYSATYTDEADQENPTWSSPRRLADGVINKSFGKGLVCFTKLVGISNFNLCISCVKCNKLNFLRAHNSAETTAPKGANMAVRVFN